MNIERIDILKKLNIIGGNLYCPDHSAKMVKGNDNDANGYGK
jgi:hypothetical protein